MYLHIHVKNNTRRFISLIKVLSARKIVSSTYDKPIVYACESVFATSYTYMYISTNMII